MKYVFQQSLFSLIWKNKSLIKQFTRREISSRYRGSVLGFFWSILNPLFMLIIYTYVFSVILNAKWGSGSANKIEFAMILFCGITTFNLFAEVVSRAPSLILSNVNYVKKVVFPLAILPVVTICSAMVNFIINIIILFLTMTIIGNSIYWTILLLPLVILPLMLLSLGFGWIFSSLGVYFRDIGQITTIAMQALLFLSPIFYPVSIIPENLRVIYYINPIGYVVEDMRKIIIWGEAPNWLWLFYGNLIAISIALFGYWCFQKMKGGFADVL